MTDSNIAPTLQSFESRMTTLVSEQMRTAADLRELNHEIASAGLSHRALKKIVRAKLAADDGNPKPLASLREDAVDLDVYLSVLAPEAPKMEDAA
jgi:uncharacterized protein (UPF0335 family)